MGYLISFFFVFVVIGMATVLQKKGILMEEGSRKMIHIGVSNWWILAMIFFDSPWEASVVPLCFVGINYVSYKKQLFSAMERDGQKEDLGTVYYAVSLFLLAIWTFWMKRPEIGLLGILIMGYGDGFAAVVGKKFGRRKLPWNKKKTVEGSGVVFFFGAILTMIVLHLYYPQISGLECVWITVIMGVLSFGVESVTPFGLDNLSLPILSSLTFYGLLNILL